jgi:phycoerythrin-associated linker protein
LIGDLASNRATKIIPPATGTGVSGSMRKRFRITAVKAGRGVHLTQSQSTFEVAYSRLSQNIQNIQKAGGKILNVVEVA